MNAVRHDQEWQYMQKRLIKVEKRKGLIPRIESTRKSAVILSYQDAKRNQGAINGHNPQKRQELKDIMQTLDEMLKEYQVLADFEVQVLETSLEKLRKEVRESDTYDLDKEDHLANLERSLSTLKEEIAQVVRPLPKPDV